VQLQLKLGSVLRLPCPMAASVIQSDATVCSGAVVGSLLVLTAHKPGSCTFMIQNGLLFSTVLDVVITPS
jgi:hypothetical protein